MTAHRKPGERALSTGTVQRLSGRMVGEALVLGDPGYDEARRVFNAMIDQRPEVIVRCADASDVAQGIDLARSHGLDLSVKGGGHSVAGHAVADGAVMLDLSPMKEARVDPDARTVRVGPGLTLGEFDRATQAHDLATPTGVVSMTGLAGLTLGGGLGWLSGRYGLACDNLVSAQVVTADGESVTAAPDQKPDLFWALRGGGGNFGVVTEFRFRLHPVRDVIGGGVTYPAGMAPEALSFYHEFASAAPDDLTTSGSVWRDEDGQVRVSVGICFLGPSDVADEVLAPLRAFGPPEADEIGRLRYSDLQRASDGGFPTGRQHYWKSSSLPAIDREAAEILVDFVSRMPSEFSGIGLQQLHGAATRVDADATAFSNRSSHYDLLVLSQWEDPADSGVNIAWTRNLHQALQPFSDGSVYVNNLGKEGDERVREAYGPNFERLAAIKHRYDPSNFFRLNHNLPPRARVDK